MVLQYLLKQPKYCNPDQHIRLCGFVVGAVTAASAGCVFKNPDPERSGGMTAGQLVDACGLKGRRIGGAEVSERHANFIVNVGGATATDVLGLMDLVRAEVAEQRGVELAFEVKRWIAGPEG